VAERRIYRVSFMQQGEVYEVYAEGVSQGNLFGFIELEGLLFGERSEVLVDPSQEKLENEFKGVDRTYVPMHAVLRIDEVTKPGVSRITKPEGEAAKVASFPSPIYTPTGSPERS
jgi:hypothetical protein